MVGTNFQNPNMRWAKITNINELHESSIHGHIFVLTDGGFRAYEFQDGPLPDFTNVGRDFLVEFARYVLDHNLADLIGLQAFGDGPCNNRGMSELILDQGTKEPSCWTTPSSRIVSRLVLRAGHSSLAMETLVPAWPTRLIRR